MPSRTARPGATARAAPPRISTFAASRARSAASTGAVSGRTPRQRKKASAACSTSMPRPSRPRAPCASAQAMKPCAAGPYIMSSASAPGASTALSTGTCAPCRLEAVALITTSKRSPASRGARAPCAAAGQIGMARDQFLRLGHGAIRHHQHRRPRFAAGPERARPPPARADQQHAFSSATPALASMSRTGRCRRCCRPASRLRPPVEAQRVGGLGAQRARWRAASARRPRT